MSTVLFASLLCYTSNSIYVGELSIKTPYKWKEGFSVIYNDTLYYFGGMFANNDDVNYYNYVDVSALDLSSINIKNTGGTAILGNNKVTWDVIATHLLPISFGSIYSEAIYNKGQILTSIGNMVYIFNPRSNFKIYSDDLVIFDLNTLQYYSNNIYSSTTYQYLRGCCATNNITHIFGVGGRIASSSNLFFQSLQIYHISTDTWSLGDDLNELRDFAGCTYLDDGHIYVFGGNGNDKYNIKSIEKYNTLRNYTWEYAGYLQQGVSMEKCITNNINNKIYCIHSNDILNSIEEYNPITEISKIVGYFNSKRANFMANIYYIDNGIDDKFAMLLVFGGDTSINDIFIEYSLFKNNTYQHPKNPYLIGWSFQNSFCFPIYWYPVFAVCSSILFFICISLMNSFKNVDDESDKSQKFIQKRKDDTIQMIVSCSSLPIDIANVIVSDFLFGSEETNFFIKLLNNKLSIKRERTAIFLFYYNILGGIFYIILFCLIIMEHIDYNTQQQQSYDECIRNSLDNNDCNKYNEWDSFQGWIMSILLIHPMFIPINYIHAIYVLIQFERLKKKKRWILAFPYFLILSSCLLPGFFTMAIPAFFLYFPTFIMFAILLSIICFWIYFVKKELNKALEENPSLILNVALIIGCILYMILVIMMASIWCFFDGNDWDQCFEWGLKSGYCPKITIDCTNWNALILLITWILF